VQGIKEKKKLEDVIKRDILTVDPSEYVQDLFPKAIESTYPLAVVNDEKRLQGIILRVHVLSSLAAEDTETAQT
jgi:glycine betaine/proline transport system ATP-binding protein